MRAQARLRPGPSPITVSLSPFCKVLPTAGAQWPPGPCVHSGTGCGQRNELIRCFLPHSRPSPVPGAQAAPPPRHAAPASGSLRSVPHPARSWRGGTPELWTLRAGYSLLRAQSLQVTLGGSRGPPQASPPALARVGGGAVQRVVSALLGHQMVGWAVGGASVHFTGEETESGRSPCSTSGWSQLQPGRRGVCRPDRDAPSCLPPPPTSGSGQSVQGAKGRAVPMAASGPPPGPSPLSLTSRPPGPRASM